MPYTLIYYRYGGRYEERHDTVEEAVDSAASGEESGDISADCVTGADGGVVLDREALRLAMSRTWDAWDAEREQHQQTP